MKLSNHLAIRLSGIFVLIMLIWSFVYFFLQMNEVYKGIDEGLEDLKYEFIHKADNSSDFIAGMEKHNPLDIIIEKISVEEVQNFEETYSTSNVYFVAEEEEEEVRMLTTAFLCKSNGQGYKLEIFTSTVESEDFIKNMLYLLIALWVCLALVIILVVRMVIRGGHKPFFKLLDNLRNFKLGETQMIEFPATNIKEYTELNKSVKDLLVSNINAYNEQKNFIENASHELQTPLTITIGKLELLVNDKKLKKEQLENVISALSGLNRMKRLNNSLLLLSKIKNKQFPNNEPVNIIPVFEEVIDDFEDLINHKGLTLNIEKKTESLNVPINKDLAYILANNLIKNAISHNIKNGNISIVFEAGTIIISNDGVPVDNDIFKRYISSSTDTKSTGLGLSIVKSITDIYNFRITHRYQDKHIFTIDFS